MPLAPSQDQSVPDVIIVGGGLAGLITSILLSRGGLRVMLIERKKYPFHRVCGEYISCETLPFLEKHNLYPAALGPAAIDRLMVSAISGRTFTSRLELGGFGISRFRYDHWLAEQAVSSGVVILEGTTVTNIHFEEDSFTVFTSSGHVQSTRLVIGAHGKRSKLDKQLQRTFIGRRYPYVGVKYHVQTDVAARDTVALHNFRGGYCGVCKVEEDKYNVCYLIHRDQLKKYGNIAAAEALVLKKNPHLGELFRDSEFVFDRPEVINEISFEKKEAVYDHVLMAGDAAGMITPLCGNGMAMAIHSARLLAGNILAHWQGGAFDRQRLEQSYQQQWDELFARRLWMGRQLQSAMFGAPIASEVAVFTGRYLKPVSDALIRLTHGRPFS